MRLEGAVIAFYWTRTPVLRMFMATASLTGLTQQIVMLPFGVGCGRRMVIFGEGVVECEPLAAVFQVPIMYPNTVSTCFRCSGSCSYSFFSRAECQVSVA